MNDWLEIHRGTEPLVVSFPHTGSDIPNDLQPGFVSPWLARNDTDWFVEKLYAFARDLGATTICTRISRSAIDCNRDPSGSSLYPGQATTELCPTTTFDGEPLYLGSGPDEQEIARRRHRWFDPYHAAVRSELSRLSVSHNRVVLYDAHSIWGYISRLFDGQLPEFNIGTNAGATCDAELAEAVVRECEASGRSHVLDGRFKGGWTVRNYGRPADGIHAIQMELAMRTYLPEPADRSVGNWPGAFDPTCAQPLTATLSSILKTCIAFARS